jgi:hypothetical protein
MFIGAVERHEGVGAFMSMTAVPPWALYVLAP